MPMLYGISERKKALCDQYAVLADACYTIRILCLDSNCGLVNADNAISAVRKVMADLAKEIDECK